MGKKSVKENKNVYQRAREARGLTREAAGEALVFISPDRIEKLESGRAAPHPDEVLAMERAYRAAGLCNHYCTHECPIGEKYVPEARLKELSQITVELISALNALEKEKDRLIDISVDGRVNDFERRDFDAIARKLTAMESSIRSLRIWVEHAEQAGKIDEAE